MDSVLQYSTMAGIALQAGLLGKFLHRQYWRVRPVFVALVGCCLVTSAFEFVIYYTRLFTVHDYAACYWKLTSLEFAFGFAAIGEQLNMRRFGVIAGVTIGTMLCFFPVISVFGMVSWVLVGLAGYASFRNRSVICYGMCVLWLFPAILYLPSVPLWTRGIPVYSWLFCLILWWSIPISPNE